MNRFCLYIEQEYQVLRLFFSTEVQTPTATLALTHFMSGVMLETISNSPFGGFDFGRTSVSGCLSCNAIYSSCHMACVCVNGGGGGGGGGGVGRASPSKLDFLPQIQASPLKATSLTTCAHEDSFASENQSSVVILSIKEKILQSGSMLCRT